MEVDKLSLAIEVLKILFQENDFVSSTVIHQRLIQKGIFHSEKDKVERRRLLRVLHSLEISGYIESRIPEPRGRISQEWKINIKAFPYAISLSEREVLSLLLSTAFIPERYKELSIFNYGLKAIERLSTFLKEEERVLIRKSFKHLPHFSERFVKVKDETLSLIFQAIIERKGVFIKYRNSDPVEIFPLKIFVYNGVMYVSALRKGEYRTYLVNRIKAIELSQNRIPPYLRNKHLGRVFSFSFESPFLMGIKLPLEYVKNEDIKSEVLLYPTQFFIEKSKKFIKIYLVGFLNRMFISWLLIDDIVGFIPPSEEMIEIARRKKLKVQYEKLSLRKCINEKRFNEFRFLLKDFLQDRIKKLV
jgi:hypothetical protein